MGFTFHKARSSTGIIPSLCMDPNKVINLTLRGSFFKDEVQVDFSINQKTFDITIIYQEEILDRVMGFDRVAMLKHITGSSDFVKGDKGMSIAIEKDLLFTFYFYHQASKSDKIRLAPTQRFDLSADSMVILRHSLLRAAAL